MTNEIKVAACGSALLFKTNINKHFARGPIGRISVNGTTVASGQWRYISTRWVALLTK